MAVVNAFTRNFIPTWLTGSTTTPGISSTSAIGGVLPQTYTHALSGVPFPGYTITQAPGYTTTQAPGYTTTQGSVPIVQAVPNTLSDSLLTEAPPSTTKGYSGINLSTGKPNFIPDPKGPTILNDHMIAVQNGVIQEHIQKQSDLIEKGHLSTTQPPTTFTPGTTSASPSQGTPEDMPLIKDSNGLLVPNQELRGMFTEIKFIRHPNDTAGGVTLLSHVKYPMWVVATPMIEFGGMIHDANTLRRKVKVQGEGEAKNMGYQIASYPYNEIQGDINLITQNYPLPLVGELQYSTKLSFIRKPQMLKQFIDLAANSPNGIFNQTMFEPTENSFGFSFKPYKAGSRKRKRTTRKYKNRKLSYKRNNKKRTTKNRRRYSRRK
jgi:hypothetical protein